MSRSIASIGSDGADDCDGEWCGAWNCGIGQYVGACMGDGATWTGVWPEGIAANGPVGCSMFGAADDEATGAETGPWLSWPLLVGARPPGQAHSRP